MAVSHVSHLSLVSLSIDAADPRALARFWAQALRWEIGPAGDDQVTLVPTDVTSFGIVFRRSALPKIGQNRIHLDLTTSSPDDQSESERELLAAGAQHADVGQGPTETHIVLADPEGNELCLIEPENRFLGSCPRLGAVNCDGTHALGVFWSGVLGWPLVWDEGEETAIQAPDGTGPKITWSGPPLIPRPPRERMHLHVAPSPGTSLEEAIDHVLGHGALRGGDADACPGGLAFTDVDGNPFCVHPAASLGPASFGA